MPSIDGVTLGIVSAGIALVVMVLFGFEAVWSVRQALRQPTATLEALRKHDQAAGSLGRAAAIAATIASAAVTYVTDEPDYLLPTMPLSIGAAVGLLVLILMEQRWPAPGGTVRSANLQRRGLGDVLPRAGIWIAGIAVLLDTGSVLVCDALDAMSPGRTGPVTAVAAWPNWQWSTPRLIGLGVVVVALLVVVVQLLHRPALAGFDRAIDLRFRRSGVDRALRVVAFVGFCQFAAVLNAIKNAGLDAGISYGVIKAVMWASISAALAALVSIPAFRTHPPKQADPEVNVAVATR